VKQLRDDEIGHLLKRDEPTPTTERSDIWEVADATERLVLTLREGLGMSSPSHFITVMKNQIKPGQGLFWGTYLAETDRTK
jgi:hypothetical protein